MLDVKINNWLLCFLTDSRIYPTVSLTTAEMNVKGSLLALRAFTRTAGIHV